LHPAPVYTGSGPSLFPAGRDLSVEPQMNADGHRLSPEPNPILASSRAAPTGGCQELGDLRTEAAERNIVAKTTLLHACSTEEFPGQRLPVTQSAFWFLLSEFWTIRFGSLCLSASICGSISVSGSGPPENRTAAGAAGSLSVLSATARSCPACLVPVCPASVRSSRRP
jgi:hypothetical protein